MGNDLICKFNKVEGKQSLDLEAVEDLMFPQCRCCSQQGSHREKEGNNITSDVLSEA